MNAAAKSFLQPEALVILVLLGLLAVWVYVGPDYLSGRGGLGANCRPDGTCKGDLVCRTYQYGPGGAFHYQCVFPNQAK